MSPEDERKQTTQESNDDLLDEAYTRLPGVAELMELYGAVEEVYVGATAAAGETPELVASTSTQMD
jgi:hypothetical protein